MLQEVVQTTKCGLNQSSNSMETKHLMQIFATDNTMNSNSIDRVTEKNLINF